MACGRRPHGRPPPRARRAHEAPRAAALPRRARMAPQRKSRWCVACACVHALVRACTKGKEGASIHETKRNETKRNETKRNETKRNETKRNETGKEKKLGEIKDDWIGTPTDAITVSTTNHAHREMLHGRLLQATHEGSSVFWVLGGGGERGRDRQKDGPRGGGSLRPTSPSAVTTFGAHHHRRGGAHGRRPLEGPASSARGPSWARPAGGKRTPVGPPPPTAPSLSVVGARDRGEAPAIPRRAPTGERGTGGGPRADAGPAGAGDERPHAAAHVRRHEGSKKGPQKKCTKGHRARETLATGNPPQGRAPGQGRGGPTGGGGGGSRKAAEGPRATPKRKKKKEKRKKGDRSAEQGLNLRGSWEHAHSAPYNTPFLT